MSQRSSIAAPLMVIVLMLAVPLAVYVAGYFWLGERLDWPAPPRGGRDTIERMYSSQWQTTMFAPAAKVESLLSRVEVELTYWEEAGPAVIEREW